MNRPFLQFFLFILLFAACAPQQPATLIIMTHDSFAVSEAVVKAFEEANGVTLVFLPSGDAGTMLNKAILSKEAPLADVLFGVDNTFLSRALDAGMYEPYASPVLQTIPPEFQLDPLNRTLPVDFADVCINYDKAYFAGNNLPVPDSLGTDADRAKGNIQIVREDHHIGKWYLVEVHQSLHRLTREVHKGLRLGRPALRQDY